MMLTMAIMQPYVFPYLGYFQLLSAVDEFCFLDDAAFIKKGFIHRNSINLQGRPYRFVLNVDGISQNRLIIDHDFIGDFSSLFRTFRHAYGHHPHFRPVLELIEGV